MHIRYFIGYVYHICLQDTIQSTQSVCLLCQAMLLPMPLRPLLLITRSGFPTTESGAHEKKPAPRKKKADGGSSLQPKAPKKEKNVKAKVRPQPQARQKNDSATQDPKEVESPNKAS